VVNKGVYSLVRHPQYLGGMIAHIGFSVFLSAFCSLVIMPLIIMFIYILSWKEEKELIKEFSKEYEEYKKNVPMLIPKIFR